MPRAQIDRRSLLRGALASGPFRTGCALHRRTNQAAAVGPNDNIKVTKVEAFVLKNSWVFVKISTDAGIVGWGEMLKDDAKACAAGAVEVGRYLVGQDPNRVVFHWQAIHRGAFYRGGPIKTAILSGIDQALWDIKGKVYGVPVYKLLGGPTRDRIRVYGQVNAANGVNAMKVAPNASRAAFKYVEGQKFVDEVAERFKALRERHGSGVDIGIDFHGAVQPPTAVAADQSARAVSALVLRRGGAAAKRGRDGRAGEEDPHPAGDRRAHLHQVGLPRDSREARRDDPAARRLLCGRDHGISSDRRHGGGILLAASRRTIRRDPARSRRACRWRRRSRIS